MEKFFAVLCCVLFCLNNYVLGSKFPASMKMCSKSDKDFDKCVAKQMSIALHDFRDGSKELGIPKLEPFYIPKLEFSGQSGSSVTLNQKYENMETFGISSSEVYDGKYNVKPDEKCYWSMHVLTPDIYFTADYELKGQVMVFPINGHGKCNISMKNLNNHHQAHCERYEKKGKTHLRVTNYTIDMQVDGIHFDFQNVMPGNEEISAQILKTVNEFSLDIFKDVKHGFETLWNALHMQTANNVFSRIPENELFLD